MSSSNLTSPPIGAGSSRILVVDDDSNVLATYREILSLQPTQVDPEFKELLSEISPNDELDALDILVDYCSSGEEAIEKVQQADNENRPYSIVFMDIRMPLGMDGVKAAAEIRKIDSLIYVVFVSAYSDYSVDQMQHKMEKNMLVISKPFQEDMLKQTARTLCMIWKREHALTAAHHQLKILSNTMQHQATHDGLTGVYNRHYLATTFNREVSRCFREKKSIGVLMLDVDRFKNYNDKFGHLQGDQTLHAIAHSLKTVVKRTSDVVARYGGEEFCIILPDTGLEATQAIAEKVRKGVENLKISFPSNDVSPYITISIGGTCCIPANRDDSRPLLSQADRLLYQAKESGRNRSLVEPCNKEEKE